ncbi:MAG: hypothetical protein EKK42_20250 [Pseudonocardiaceae bacterium]|nr:MAG: hypothetical protein EKK42_20250 [Pseudonocardiaceae bacterium]
MPSRTFTVDELEEFGAECEGEYRRSIDSGRWYEYFETVFRAGDDGKLYLVYTKEGLTEYQECSGADVFTDAELINDEWVVECPEVEIFEEVQPVTKWRKVS